MEKIYQLAFDFIEQEPQAAARLLETSDATHILPFLVNTPAPMVAQVLRKMLPEYAANLLMTADNATAQLWMQEIRTRPLSVILRRIPPAQQSKLLDCLTIKKKTACQLLLSFREDMVGAIVETDIIVFPNDMEVEDAVKRIKQRRYAEERIALVIDDDRKYTGEVSLIQLLHASRSLTVGDIQQASPAAISGRSLIRSALSHPVWQTRDSAAVVNRQRELIGIVWYSQIRQALMASTTNRLNDSSGHLPLLDIVHVHGDSMRALIDVIAKPNV